MRYVFILIIFLNSLQTHATNEKTMLAALKYYKLGNCEKTITLLVSVKNTAHSEFLKGMCFVKLNQKSEAKTAFKRVLSLDPPLNLKSRSEQYLVLLNDEIALNENSLLALSSNFLYGYNSNIYLFGEGQIKRNGYFISGSPRISYTLYLGGNSKLEPALYLFFIEYFQRTEMQYFFGNFELPFQIQLQALYIQISTEMRQEFLASKNFVRNYTGKLNLKYELSSSWALGGTNSISRTIRIDPRYSFLTGTLFRTKPFIQYNHDIFYIKFAYEIGKETKGKWTTNGLEIPLSNSFQGLEVAARILFSENLYFDFMYNNTIRSYTENFKPLNKLRNDAAEIYFLSINYWFNDHFGINGDIKLSKNASSINTVDGIDLGYEQNTYAAGFKIQL